MFRTRTLTAAEILPGAVSPTSRRPAAVGTTRTVCGPGAPCRSTRVRPSSAPPRVPATTRRIAEGGAVTRADTRHGVSQVTAMAGSPGAVAGTATGAGTISRRPPASRSRA